MLQYPEPVSAKKRIIEFVYIRSLKATRLLPTSF